MTGVEVKQLMRELQQRHGAAKKLLSDATMRVVVHIGMSLLPIFFPSPCPPSSKTNKKTKKN